MQAIEKVDESATTKSGAAIGEKRVDPALRVAPHRFGVGNRANPNGRPPVVRDIVLLARKHTAEALETLAEIMRSRKSPAAARVRAAEVLLDRGYGRSQQTLNIVAHIANTELEALARRILLKREKVTALEAAKVVEATVSESEEEQIP